MAGPVLIPAASVLLIREPFEVFMILRHENRSFVPNAWARNLEAIAGFSSAAELMAARRGAKIEAIQPVVVVEDGRKKIVLP